MTTDEAIERYCNACADKAGYQNQRGPRDAYKYGVLKAIAIASIDSCLTGNHAVKEIKRIRDHTGAINVGPI